MERYGVMKNSEGYSDPTAGAVLKKEGALSKPLKVKRGDIFYISIPFATGHEMEKDRPGIVVSCDELNDTSPCIIVVLCTAALKKDLPEHVIINSTPTKSTAMCEHICTVDKSRLDRYVGRCTDTEMERVSCGIMAGLNIGCLDLASPAEPPVERAPEPIIQESTLPSLELVRTEAERDTYRDLYERLLDRVTA